MNLSESKRNSLVPVPSPTFNPVVTRAAQEVSCQNGYPFLLPGFSACGYCFLWEVAGEAGPDAQWGKAPPHTHLAWSVPPAHGQGSSQGHGHTLSRGHVLISELPQDLWLNSMSSSAFVTSYSFLQPRRCCKQANPIETPATQGIPRNAAPCL